MENKYQEALDRLKNNISIHDVVLTYPPVDKTQNDLDTLQELVNNYAKLEKALDKACKFYHDFYASESELTTEQWKEWLLKDE